MQSRRSFILSSLLVVGGAATGVYFYKSSTESKEELAVNGVINQLADLPGAIRFGKILRKQASGKTFTDSLKSISERLQNNYGEFSYENIGAVLEQQIQKEFRSNQFALVDGWYLSRTEAELCLLASMVSKA